MSTPIADQESYALALERIERLWDAPPGSDAEHELEALATFVDAYERRAFPILPPDPRKTPTEPGSDRLL